MERIRVIAIFLQLLLVQDVFTRSIDQIIAQVEEDFTSQLGVEARSAIPVWYDYTLANRSEKLVKLQHDMILTKDTWLDVINTTEELPQDRRSKRNAVLEKNSLWTRRISYTISEGFSVVDKYRMLEAMNHWEEYTCLKFVEAKPIDLDIIVYTPMNGTCESVVGRLGGKQPINLSKGCMYKEILVHEIGHALGFYHEHMRADRDQYVKINYMNIPTNDSTMRQFDPLVATDYNDYNKPYDYYSVMHYGKLFFSINSSAGLVTIEPNEPEYLDIIGNSPGLSYYDMQIANDLYNCSDGCPDVDCPQGFIGGSNCECFCQYKDDPFDVRICEAKSTCKLPNIDLAKYTVYDHAYKEIVFAAKATFPHRAQFIVMVRDINCKDVESQYTCMDGNWTGELPPCVKVIPAHLQEKCTVQYDIEKFVVTSNGVLQDNGALVQSQTPVNVTCKHMTPGIDDDQPVYCEEGRWEYDIEHALKCQVQQFCPMVNNAIMTGSFEDGFTISCIDRHSFAEVGGTSAKFSCNLQGVWKPFAPACKPNNCTVPDTDNKGVITDVNNDALNANAVVIHGSDVILTCDKSYVPDEAKYTCSYGSYNTLDGKIPQCVQVTCGEPSVKGSKYKPKKLSYLYGDVVSIGRCRNRKWDLIGDRKLHCTKHGNWSNTAECKPYCQGGIDVFDIRQDTTLKHVGIWNTTSNMNSFQSCKRRCIHQSRYICRGFEFGHDGSRYKCTLYARPANVLETLYKETPFWTTSIRTCKQHGS